MRPIILNVKAKHFKNRCFNSNGICPLAAAAREQLKSKNVSESVIYLEVGKKEYTHAYYGIEEYNKDFKVAEKNKFSNKIIRKIKLEPNK